MRSAATQTTPTLPGTATPFGAGLPVSPWLAAGLLAVLTVALYWPATRCDFVNYDDPDFVTGNLHVQRGLTWEGVKWACVSPVSCNWHPVTMLSHMLDCQMFGVNPRGHHLNSVLLHAINAVLLFALLWQMTGATWRSLFVAALFAVHPLRVESVAWVAERKDLLSGFFGLLSLICYAAYARKRLEVERQQTQHCEAAAFVSWRWRFDYLLALCFLVLGLMSKPMLVTWPFVLLLLDYWPLGRFQAHSPQSPDRKWQIVYRLLLEKVPFFLAAAAFSAVTFVVQNQGGALKAVGEFPLSVRCENALISYCRYLGKLLWPTGLAVYYPHPGQWPMGLVLLAGGLVFGISVLVFVQRRRLPFSLVGWLWYCGTLMPVIGLVQVGGQAMADRYTYLPSIGLLVLAVWGACDLGGRWRYHRGVLPVVGLAAIMLCLALTRHQLGVWRDSETLFRHAILVTRDNYIAHINLGSALDEKGASAEALRHYQEALRLKPDNATAHYDLGVALLRMGETGKGISKYQEAIRLKPDYAEAHYSLGNALIKNGQLQPAIREFQQAIRLNPDLVEAHNNLGFALAREHRFDEAVRELQEALRLKPDHANARRNLEAVLAAKARIEDRR
jgi:tetratricopeptide (TPR) repeat protein